MKKIVKVLVVVGVIIGGVAGILYFLDKKNKEDEFEEFDDAEFDDVFEEEFGRDYVTLDFDNKAENETETEEE